MRQPYHILIISHPASPLSLYFLYSVCCIPAFPHLSYALLPVRFCIFHMPSYLCAPVSIYVLSYLYASVSFIRPLTCALLYLAYVLSPVRPCIFHTISHTRALLYLAYVLSYPCASVSCIRPLIHTPLYLAHVLSAAFVSSGPCRTLRQLLCPVPANLCVPLPSRRSVH